MVQSYKWDSYGTSYKGGKRIEITVVRGKNPIPASDGELVTGSFPYPQDPSANVIYAIGDLATSGDALKAAHALPTVQLTIPQFRELIEMIS